MRSIKTSCGGVLLIVVAALLSAVPSASALASEEAAAARLTSLLEGEVGLGKAEVQDFMGLLSSLRIDPVEVDTVGKLLGKMEAGIDGYSSSLAKLDAPRLAKLQAGMKALDDKTAKLAKERAAAEASVKVAAIAFKAAADNEAKESKELAEEEADAEKQMSNKDRRVSVEVRHVDEQRAYIGKIRSSLERMKKKINEEAVKSGPPRDGGKSGNSKRRGPSHKMRLCERDARDLDYWIRGCERDGRDLG